MATLNGSSCQKCLCCLKNLMSTLLCRNRHNSCRRSLVSVWPPPPFSPVPASTTLEQARTGQQRYLSYGRMLSDGGAISKWQYALLRCTNWDAIRGAAAFQMMRCIFPFTQARYRPAGSHQRIGQIWIIYLNGINIFVICLQLDLSI